MGLDYKLHLMYGWHNTSKKINLNEVIVENDPEGDNSPIICGSSKTRLMLVDDRMCGNYQAFGIVVDDWDPLNDDGKLFEFPLQVNNLTSKLDEELIEEIHKYCPYLISEGIYDEAGLMFDELPHLMLVNVIW